MNQNSHPIIVRDMLRQDLVTSVAIIKKEFLSSATKRGFERMAEANKKLLVCQVATTSDNVIIGVIVYLLAQECIRIIILAVTAEFQGCGVATEMLKKAERRAERAPSRTSIMATVPENLLPNGAMFLRKRGYLAIGIERASDPSAAAVSGTINTSQTDLIVMSKAIVRPLEASLTQGAVTAKAI